MLFRLLQDRLVLHVRNRVRAGEITERQLARLTGMSQPHTHNVLKGIRFLSPEYADRIVEHLHLTVADLLTGPEMGVHPVNEVGLTAFIPKMKQSLANSIFDIENMELAGVYPMPRAMIDSLVRPVLVPLLHDEDLYPQFQEGDMALIDRAPTSQGGVRPGALYLVHTEKGTVVRTVRAGGTRLYLITPRTAQEPRSWDSVSLNGRDMNSIIKGRLIWIGRQIAPGRS